MVEGKKGECGMWQRGVYATLAYTMSELYIYIYIYLTADRTRSLTMRSGDVWGKMGSVTCRENGSERKQVGVRVGVREDQLGLG